MTDPLDENLKRMIPKHKPVPMPEQLKDKVYESMKTKQEQIASQNKPRHVHWVWYLTAAAAFIIGLPIYMWVQTPIEPEIQVLSGRIRFVDNRILTHQLEPAEVRLSDKTTVQLAKDTELVIKEKKDHQIVQLRLEEGSASFDVPRRDTPLEIDTDAAKVVVLGTKFKLDLVYEDEKGERAMKKISGSFAILTVLVLEGSVSVKNSYAEQRLHTGEYALIRQDGQPSKVDKETIAKLEELVKLLTDDEPQVREKALAELEKFLDSPAKAELIRQKVKSAELDLRERLNRLLTRYEAKMEELQFTSREQDRKWINEGECSSAGKAHAIGCCGAKQSCERCQNKETVHKICATCAGEIGICLHCQQPLKIDIEKLIEKMDLKGKEKTDWPRLVGEKLLKGASLLTLVERMALGRKIVDDLSYHHWDRVCGHAVLEETWFYVELFQYWRFNNFFHRVMEHLPAKLCDKVTKSLLIKLKDANKRWAFRIGPILAIAVGRDKRYQEAVVKAMLVKLEDKDPEMRGIAAYAFAKGLPCDDKVLGKIIRALGDTLVDNNMVIWNYSPQPSLYALGLLAPRLDGELLKDAISAVEAATKSDKLEKLRHTNHGQAFIAESKITLEKLEKRKQELE